jgi:hypothetical protein
MPLINNSICGCQVATASAAWRTMRGRVTADVATHSLSPDRPEAICCAVPAALSDTRKYLTETLVFRNNLGRRGGK